MAEGYTYSKRKITPSSSCTLWQTVSERTDEMTNGDIFSSPEPKAQGELIGWESSGRPSVRPSVHTFGPVPYFRGD